jgi:hypothetical protein
VSLRDEIAADQGKPTQCALCRWLNTLDRKERTEWVEVLADRAFTHASIHRALLRRNAPVGRTSVETHRTGGHK